MLPLDEGMHEPISFNTTYISTIMAELTYNAKGGFKTVKEGGCESEMTEEDVKKMQKENDMTKNTFKKLKEN